MTPEKPTTTVEKKKRTRKPKVTQETVVEARKKNLAERLLAVQTEAKTVLKTGNNKYSHYTYATEGNYQNELKPLLTKHGITIAPKGVMDFKAIGATIFVTMKWQLINTDNVKDTFTFTFVGSGRDTEAKGAEVGDKAVAKAMTMANKYMLAKVFQLESEDDADKQPEDKGDKKGGKKGDTPATGNKESGSDYATAVNMIKNSNNVTGLIDWAEKIKDSKKYTAEQKNELQKMISSRVDALQNNG